MSKMRREERRFRGIYRRVLTLPCRGLGFTLRGVRRVSGLADLLLLAGFLRNETILLQGQGELADSV